MRSRLLRGSPAMDGLPVVLLYPGLASGIMSFAPIAFVKDAAWNGEQHGTAIRGAVGGDVGGCGSPPRDCGGDADAVGDLRRAVRGVTRRARATTPCLRVHDRTAVGPQ